MSFDYLFRYFFSIWFTYFSKLKKFILLFSFSPENIFPLKTQKNEFTWTQIELLFIFLIFMGLVIYFFVFKTCHFRCVDYFLFSYLPTFFHYFWLITPSIIILFFWFHSMISMFYLFFFKLFCMQGVHLIIIVWLFFHSLWIFKLDLMYFNFFSN